MNLDLSMKIHSSAYINLCYPCALFVLIDFISPLLGASMTETAELAAKLKLEGEKLLELF